MAKKKSLTGNTFLGDLLRDTTKDEAGEAATEQAGTAQGPHVPTTTEVQSTPDVSDVSEKANEPEMVKVTFRYRPDQIAAMRILGFIDRFQTQQDYIHDAIDAMLKRKDIKAMLEEGQGMYIQYLEKKLTTGKKLNEIDRYIYDTYRKSS